MDRQAAPTAARNCRNILAAKSTIVRRQWTGAERDILKQYVPQYTEETADWQRVNWADVANKIEGRSPEWCYAQACTMWPVKGPWSEVEAATLAEILPRGPKEPWSKYAYRHGHGRNGKQLRERVTNHLSREEMVISEDQQSQLLQLIADHDQQPRYRRGKLSRPWAKFARVVEHNDNRLKNHWNSTLYRQVANGQVPGYRLTKNKLLIRHDKDQADAPEMDAPEIEGDVASADAAEGDQADDSVDMPLAAPPPAAPPQIRSPFTTPPASPTKIFCPIVPAATHEASAIKPVDSLLQPYDDADLADRLWGAYPPVDEPELPEFL